MPGSSTIQSFVNDLRTGKSNIARALDNLFGTERALQRAQGHAYLNDLRADGALNTLPGWARTELSARGVKPKELQHIDRWPNPDKDRVRAKLVDSIDNVLPLEFLWELYGGDDEDTDVPPLGSSGKVIFRSPRSRVRVMSAATLGEIRVDVGP